MIARIRKPKELIIFQNWGETNSALMIFHKVEIRKDLISFDEMMIYAIRPS